MREGKKKRKIKKKKERKASFKFILFIYQIKALLLQKKYNKVSKTKRNEKGNQLDLSAKNVH